VGFVRFGDDLDERGFLEAVASLRESDEQARDLGVELGVFRARALDEAGAFLLALLDRLL